MYLRTYVRTYVCTYVRTYVRIRNHCGAEGSPRFVCCILHFLILFWNMLVNLNGCHVFCKAVEIEIHKLTPNNHGVAQGMPKMWSCQGLANPSPYTYIRKHGILPSVLPRCSALHCVCYLACGVQSVVRGCGHVGLGLGLFKRKTKGTYGTLWTPMGPCEALWDPMEP